MARLAALSDLHDFTRGCPGMRLRSALGCATVCVVATLGAAGPAAAQSADNVAVVINDDSPESQKIGEHYVRVRAIPGTNVIRVHAPATETISATEYTNAIEGPVRAALGRHRLQDQVLYIVLTKGIPLRIEGTEGLDGTGASVDSELTLLYRRMTGKLVPTRGRIANPYFESGPARQVHEPFSHRDHDIYLVTRLDGFTVDDTIALIDRAQKAMASGRFVLDQRGGVVNNPTGDVWLSEARRRLAVLGFEERTVLEATREPARNVDEVLGYYSWASNDPQNRSRKASMQFVPGSLAATFGGADARTFHEPPEAWTPSGNWRDRGSWFEGAPTSLIGDLIREGATGVAGHVADPFLQSAVRPEVLFPAYVAGMNLAEAFYLALPHLSWQTVVIGDPLCRIFPRDPAKPLTAEEGIDEETELPKSFAARRREGLMVQLKDLPLAAQAPLIRSESRLARGDRPGAREALEQLTKAAPRLVIAPLQLAMLYEQDNDLVRAEPLYEQVLELQADNVVALNNLAYLLAVFRKSPDKARPLAVRAVKLAPRDPTITDTLAWVEYLLGNQAAATSLIAAAAKGAPKNKDIRLHAAFIYAAGQALDAARAELKAALSLDPALSARDDVQELERRLRPTSDAFHP